MATFPSQASIHSLIKSVKPITSQSSLGDGYLTSHKIGLNLSKLEWQLEWLVDLADASSIDTFLRQRANDEEAFEWTAPDETVATKWRCEEWNVEQIGAEVYRVTATFNEAAEITISQLNSVFSNNCDTEFLCEPDYGVNNQADFWLSRITAPISNQDPQLYGTGAPVGHGIVMDDQGYSYHVWAHTPYSGFMYPYGWIVITKRDLGGNIIWTKKTKLNIVVIVMYYVGIHDVDGQGKSLVVIARTQYGYTNTNPVFSLNEDWCAVFSLQGNFKHAFTTYLPVGFGAGYSPVTKNLACCAGDLNAVSPFYNVLNVQTGAFVANWYTRIPGTIYASGDLASDGGMVQFSSTKQLVFWNIGTNRLQVIRLNSYVPEGTSTIIGNPGGAYCTAVKYENTALVFIGSYIYQYDSDGNIMRRITMSADYAGWFNIRWSVQLDKENDNIYINGGNYVYTLSYDLTKLKTLTNLNPGGNTYAGRNGTSEGGQNMLSLNANRFVLSMDTLAGYYQSASGGRALLMAAGGRLSETGSLVTMNAGGFNATAQGIVINATLSSTTSISSYSQSLIIYQGATSMGVAARTTTVLDATSEYTWDLYESQYA